MCSSVVVIQKQVEPLKNFSFHVICLEQKLPDFSGLHAEGTIEVDNMMSKLTYAALVKLGQKMASLT